MTRTAIVTGARDGAQVAAYLPRGYTVTGEDHDANGRLLVLIAGEDSLGWTLDDYVIPRLASGLLWATETDSAADSDTSVYGAGSV